MPQGAKGKAVGKPVPDPYKAGLAGRIAKAFKSYNADAEAGEEIGQKELGQLVAERMGLPAAITQPAVSGWMNVRDPAAPDNPTLAAIAYVLGVNAGWLAFNGDTPMRPAAGAVGPPDATRPTAEYTAAVARLVALLSEGDPKAAGAHNEATRAAVRLVELHTTDPDLRKKLLHFLGINPPPSEEGEGGSC